MSYVGDGNITPGPLERRLRSRVRYAILGTWGKRVVAERMAMLREHERHFRDVHGLSQTR